MRPGRKRKDKGGLLPPPREPNGQPRRLTTVEQIALAERDRAMREQQVVLAQPHRKGSTSQLAESPLGRFCEANHLRRELYDSGVEYGAMKRRWANYWNAPMADRIQGAGRGGLPIDEDARRWREWIEKAERAIVREHGDLRAIQQLCVHELPVASWIGKSYIIQGLLSLAIELGHIDPKARAR